MNLNDFLNNSNSNDIPKEFLEKMKLATQLGKVSPLIEDLMINYIAHKNVNLLKQFAFLKAEIKKKTESSSAFIQGGFLQIQNKTDDLVDIVEFLIITDNIHIVGYSQSVEEAKNGIIHDISTSMDIDDKITFMLEITNKTPEEILNNTRITDNYVDYLENKTDRIINELKTLMNV